jgi:dephospho-CoA kinase
LSKWQGKYVIGLTGNIGTGKSVVRNMLEHLGAYGIDADALAHRSISKDGPGFPQVVDLFGTWVVGPKGEIDRSRLGKIAFSDPDVLIKLETIIHPLVFQGVDYMVKRACQPVIVIEAIKLLEAGLGKVCDNIWVTVAPLETQLARLMQNRHMSELEARQRISAQPPQEEKVSAAQMVINTTSTFGDTWKQVVSAWDSILPPSDDSSSFIFQSPQEQGIFSVLRGKPSHSSEIANFLNHQRPDRKNLDHEDIMSTFSEKKILLFLVEQKLCGIMVWEVENLMARTLDIFIDPQVSAVNALPMLIKEMEKESQDLQCEIALLFVPLHLQVFSEMWNLLGYELREPSSLGVQAWEEAALKAHSLNSTIYFKQFQHDRIPHPI